jgi:peptidoglycan/LPS O-acetylase OafA/YrhL
MAPRSSSRSVSAFCPPADGSAGAREARPAFTTKLTGIDALRGLAAASVLVYHVWSKNQDYGGSDLGLLGRHVVGNLAHGVTLFFALSGFLLYLPFVTSALRDEPRPTFPAYARNRALRILPAYWFILAAVALGLHSAHLYRDGHVVAGSLTDPDLFMKDALLIQNYDRSTLDTGIAPAWTLAVEVVFYVSLPLLVMFGAALAARAPSRSGRARCLMVPAVVLAVVGVVGALAGTHLGAAFDNSFLARAHLFTVGMVLAVLRVQHQDGQFVLPRHARVVGTVAIALMLVPVLWLGGGGPGPGQTMLVSLVCGVLLALVVLPTGETSRGARFLESAPLVRAGLVSYSVYLWHMPVILFFVQHGLFIKGGVVACVADVVTVGTVVAILSTATYQLVERPALRLKSRARRAAGPPALRASTERATVTARARAAPG